MAITRIDLRINGQKWIFEATPSVDIVSHGEWKIDKVSGKNLCRIQIEGSVKQEHFYLDFVPEYPLITKLLDKYLETELNNDNFEFQEPIISDKRNPEFNKKLKGLVDIFIFWAEKTNNLKIKDKVEQLKLQI